MFIISFFTKLLHYLPGEVSHHIALKGLKLFYFLGLLKFFFKENKPDPDMKHKDITSLSNQVGIAAGLDKNGDYIDCLAALGIDFIEIGTVTPKPQKGNPKPRLFRNLKEKSLINRLGFNNKGVDYLVSRLGSRKSNVIVGTSIGKNFDTPNKFASRDYIYCLDRVYSLSDYVAVNISSPNTKDLRELSSTEYLNILLKDIKDAQERLSVNHGYKPIFIKISPDEKYDDLKTICKSILSNNIDGIICSNTTINHNNKNGSGGLSGKPLKDKATKTLIDVKSIVGNSIKLIASGGVMTVADYNEKIDSGADFVQIYTGFIYAGPKLIHDILNSKKGQ